MAFNHGGNDRNSRGGDRGGFRYRPSFGDRPRFGDRGSRGPVEMHSAVCDNCGKNCEVPFRPTSGKPVFCSDCFEKNGANSRSEGRDRSSSFDRQMFDATCDECGNSCQVPFRPSGDKPIYCNNCFGSKKGATGNGNSEPQNNQQLTDLNIKLDRILLLLEPKIAEVQELALEAEEPIVIVEDIAPKVTKSSSASKKKSPKKN
jgi:CxxC-x17-CxxC domain-containing protein